MIPVLFAVLQISAASATVDAQPSRSPALEYDGSAGQTQIVTPRFTNPDVSIDGRIDESVWDAAPVLTGFTQYDPSEGIPGSQQTEVRVFVTDDAVYFAIKALDSDPAGIRATMTERDQVTRSNDYVRVVLDTFDDQRRAYAFSVNPFGVQ